MRRKDAQFHFRNFFDDSGWATNWQIKGGGFLVQPAETGNNKTSGIGGRPNLFADPVAAYKNFRSLLPGDTGSRNVLRNPSYITLDAGLAKSFQMPWSENHKATFRWEVFNVTNTAKFTSIALNSLGYQPEKGNPPASWVNFTAQQGNPRIMQFAFRYEF